MSDKPLLPSVETQKQLLFEHPPPRNPAVLLIVRGCCVCIFILSTDTADVLFTATLHA